MTSDTLTILTSLELPLQKQFSLEDGSWQTIPFKLTWFYDCQTKNIDDFDQLGELIRSFCSDRSKAIISGKLRQHVDPNAVTRKKISSHNHTVGSCWISTEWMRDQV